MPSIADYFGIRRLPSGRAIQALGEVQRLGASLGVEQVADAAARGVQVYYEARRLQQEFIKARRAGNLRELALALDQELDSYIVGSEVTAQGHARAARHVATSLGDDANLFLNECLQDNASNITRGTYEEQAARMTELVTRYERPDIKAAAQRIGVSFYMEQVAQKLDDYKLAISRISAPVTHQHVTAANAEAHDLLCLTIATIFVYAPVEHQRALLRPIDIQDRIVFDQNRASRMKTDLNPDTNLEEPAEEV